LSVTKSFLLKLYKLKEKQNNGKRNEQNKIKGNLEQTKIENKTRKGGSCKKHCNLKASPIQLWALSPDCTERQTGLIKEK